MTTYWSNIQGIAFAGTGRASESSYYLELYKSKESGKSEEKEDSKSKGKLVATILEKAKHSDSAAAKADGVSEKVERFQVEFLLEDLENLCLADIAKSHNNGAAVMKKVESVMEAQVSGLQENQTDDQKGD